MYSLSFHEGFSLYCKFKKMVSYNTVFECIILTHNRTLDLEEIVGTGYENARPRDTGACVLTIGANS